MLVVYYAVYYAILVVYYVVFYAILVVYYVAIPADYWSTSCYQVVTSPVADSEPSSPDGPGGGGEEVEPNGMNGHAPLRQERSHTFTPNTSYKTNLQESVS